MRKLICISALLLIFAGCAKQDMVKYDPVLDFYVLPGVYRPVSEGLTDEFSTKQDFAISGWSLEQGKNWERFSSDAANWLELSRATSNDVYLTDEYASEQVKVTLWTFTEDVKWPSKDLQLSFVAYSPFKSPCECSLERGVTWRVDDITEQQTDVLYADAQVDRRNNVDGNVLSLCFEHALCRIDFRVKNRVDNEGSPSQDVAPEKITIREITVDEIKYTGTFYSRAEQQWTLRNETMPLSIYSADGFQTTGSPELIGTSWLMLPQTLDTYVTVKFDYTNFAGNTITQTLKTTSPLKTTLLAGHNYVYTLSVGIDDILFFQEDLQQGMSSPR